MHPRRLVFRGLTFYWRTNVAVVAGVAVAVAVLAGALLVGDSVRGSLRELVLGRLGKTDQVVVSSGLFREQLAGDLASDPAFASRFSAAAPLFLARGTVTAQTGGRRAGEVRIYGVDDRFWQFHGVNGVAGPGDREAYISPALAAHLGTAAGDSILVRVQRPTDVPLESLHGRRDNLDRSLRLGVAQVLAQDSLGEFSLEARQGDVLAAFVPLLRLQQELDIEGFVNTVLVATGLSPPEGPADLEALVRHRAQLDDVGFLVKDVAARGIFVLGSSGGILDEPHSAAAMKALGGMRAQQVFTYLANNIRVGAREVPYSLVTALDLDALIPNLANVSEDSVVLNAWAAADLRARVGDAVTMEYYVWEEPGQLVTKSSSFRIAGVVPIDAGDRDMAPAYPGITDSPTLDEWDPPFPVDLQRIRPVDEEYWKQYRTTPKAFVTLEAGQRLWRSRYGALTSIRITPDAGRSVSEARDAYVGSLRAMTDPLSLGLTVVDARAQGMGAARGATDFGQYFVYFSFFIVVSALVLAVLFFKLGIEQRVREVGLLRAVGFGPAQVRRLFLQEGLLLAVVGSALGVAGALGYASLMMFGLRTWWVDAVGTTALRLHVSSASLAAGALGGIVAAVACIWWTLRSLNSVSERSLLMGEIEGDHGPAKAGHYVRRWRLPLAAVGLFVLAVVLMVASAVGAINPAGGFFGAGSAILIAWLCGSLHLFRRRSRQSIAGQGWLQVSRLGLRNAGYRPGRSVLSIAVVASAVFILISVDAFRRGEQLADSGPRSGVGGYSLIVETLLPIVHDPNSQAGKDAMNLVGLDESVTFEPFRLLPGDDASCLNLYEPRNPRIMAPSDAFVKKGRFAFQSSLASTDAERANPWLLLDRAEPDGAVPVIADANSMTYVLHKSLGEEIELPRGDRTIRLRLVAALRDSIFQGELLMAQSQFLRLFPEQDGYRVLLVSTKPDRVSEVKASLDDGLADFGPTTSGTAERLAQFHRVENTYLSTFQTLGGFGLLLGTLGMAAVLLRNVLERRRELALLGAVGYRRTHVLMMVVAETALLLGGGLLAGATSAALAIAPAVAERGGRFPLTRAGALLVFVVFVTGLLSSVLAMRVGTRAPLLTALRSE
ncbi:MAG TPA: FtsX-like permease family protein [Vicinamibacterales bacterium]|nr:FtsX-like permease family protein [Vicinamibacterales bacterium]